MTLNDEIKKLGWVHSIWGAEGEFLNKDEYGLQIINQSFEDQSVINLNTKIVGIQNLHIFHVQKYIETKSQTLWQRIFNIKNEPKEYQDVQTIFYGYCGDIYHFKLICEFLFNSKIKVSNMRKIKLQKINERINN
jgi:hypothetical protein